MAYNYLLNLYKVLNERKKEIGLKLQKAVDDPEQELYEQGRLSAITDFTIFLQKNYHKKLPRRLQ
jgi:hypothetical protein